MSRIIKVSFLKLENRPTDNKLLPPKSQLDSFGFLSGTTWLWHQVFALDDVELGLVESLHILTISVAPVRGAVNIGFRSFHHLFKFSDPFLFSDCYLLAI